MPTYVYACDRCGAQLGQSEAFKDEPLRTCPSCAGAVRRVFQPVGIVFRGSGWYITDSRKSSAGVAGGDSAVKSEKSEKTESTGKSDSSSDTKSNSASKSTTD